MVKIALLVTAIALAGCASTRQERAAALQRELPQLVAACNGWFQVDPRVEGPTTRRDGLKACDRLAVGKSLTLADPDAVSAYQRYTSNKSQSQAARDFGQRGVHIVPAPLPQVQ